MGLYDARFYLRSGQLVNGKLVSVLPFSDVRCLC